MENYISIEDEQVICTHPLVKKGKKEGYLPTAFEGKLSEVLRLKLFNGEEIVFTDDKAKSLVEQANEYINELHIKNSLPTEGSKIVRISVALLDGDKMCRVYLTHYQLIAILSQSDILSAEVIDAKTGEKMSIKERVITELNLIK